MEGTAGVGQPEDGLRICGDQSRLCGESKFRELEDEFLQKQARIWLSEVLKRRLDDDLSISDMLADGDLLFEVSNILWRMLIEKGVEVGNLRIFTRTTKSKKHGGKYMPYSNVDAFLKICKIMGLTGVDLFSPSDVVERRDTRKVCMCIRFLSKKARSMDIKVPDFDIVTYTVTMPTNLIGCIRRSLELSQCGSVSSDCCNSFNDSDLPCMKNNSLVSLSKSYDYYEESDDAESSVSVGSYEPFH
uniref:Calponin-homology (CH) domain-containing protein n=1 Tax=Kalanchoe fedtschenkoi TaxID=63787 RepID=A0A7N0US28_KALFE